MIKHSDLCFFVAIIFRRHQPVAAVAVWEIPELYSHGHIYIYMGKASS